MRRLTRTEIGVAIGIAAVSAVVTTVIIVKTIAPKAACVPDVSFTPTPMLTWDLNPTAEDVDGYSLYYRYPGGTFQRLVDLPCQEIDNTGDGVPDTKLCRGGDFGWPIQRSRDDQGVQVEFCVDAYSETGRSPQCSNTVPVCMPQTWQPGESYQ